MNTELLTDYWRQRRPALGSPLRTSIDPTEFVDLLPQVFILGRANPGHYVFRLAGGLLADLHGKSLQGQDFLPLWLAADRASLKFAMEAAARRNHPLVIKAGNGPSLGQGADVEIFLAPLVGADGKIDRFLGLYQPVTPFAHRCGQAFGGLGVHTIAVAADPDFNLPAFDAPRLRLAALDGRRIA